MKNGGRGDTGGRRPKGGIDVGLSRCGQLGDQGHAANHNVASTQEQPQASKDSHQVCRPVAYENVNDDNRRQDGQEGRGFGPPKQPLFLR